MDDISIIMDDIPNKILFPLESNLAELGYNGVQIEKIIGALKFYYIYNKEKITTFKQAREEALKIANQRFKYIPKRSASSSLGAKKRLKQSETRNLEAVAARQEQEDKRDIIQEYTEKFKNKYKLIPQTINIEKIIDEYIYNASHSVNLNLYDKLDDKLYDIIDDHFKRAGLHPMEEARRDNLRPW